LADRNARRAVAIRHVAFEDLGTLGGLLEARGFDVRYVEAGRDDVAAVGDADLLVVLGGPIGAYEDETYPFLAAEAALVEARLRAGKPIVGICLGAQIMARALGARVYPNAVKEIGWAPLALTEAGRDSCLAPLGEARVLHWHGDTFDLPAGATLLASTRECLNQAYSWGRCALALQCHVEVKTQDLERWFIGHTAELASMKSVTVGGLRADTARFGPALERVGPACFERWLEEIGA
jgi:GMP synthase (glutamine-hydrolysing)